jgi:MFS family permease
MKTDRSSSRVSHPPPSFFLSAKFVILVCCCCWAFGFGLECPLASRWLQDAGHTESFIGFNTGTHFFGVIVMGAFAPALIRRCGRGCVLIGLLLSGIGVAAFPYGNNAFGYFALRLLAGAGGALAMIALETLINLHAPPDRRARDFALYACSVGVGFALGSFVGLHLFEYLPAGSFLLGGGVTLAAIPLVALLPAFPRFPRGAWEPDPGSQAERSGSHAPRGNPTAWRPPMLSVGSAWCQGFLEAGMLALLPLYLRAVGLTDGAAGNVLGGILIGVLVCQLPIGWLADRLGRERVLIGCFVVVAVGLAIVPYADRDVGLPIWLFVIGVCSGAFYPLGLALLGERVPPSEIPKANAWYLGVNCFGSLVSPLVSGPVMEIHGPQAMFWTGEAAVLGVLLLWFIARWSFSGKTWRGLLGPGSRRNQSHGLER